MNSILNPSVKACQTILLLKNGHLSTGKESIQSYNTCSFDSTYVIVAAMYTDISGIKIKIDSLKTDSAFSKMVSSMYDTNKIIAIQNSLLRQRNKILKNLFQNSKQSIKFDSGLFSIDCSSNVNYMIPKIVPKKLYSYIRNKQWLYVRNVLYLIAVSSTSILRN